ncbi:CRISPR-associated endoribonuclease Cas6 [Nostoc sp. UCD121]|uniref:CRISPR-associated endoribonuclease Cas6 n=1 Tax=unclassified Nostoc TaxID=2593658 RepID=UPI00162858DC|nr:MULTISPECIES: CRISPR-associated endoribonuclease Cas6 [unclassified Nostoc]MBC1222531.1 CRISPR-associated endoribonuclease Cas6 [Nostoc sp. UCD120]MBC1276331.1 CRISPR-associated endoribonuclease Cas6 [Nostoc sp. UCD121]MBC1295197.1 CRISPR-associated endoribonuclease Cas6 [Nostoc sp. UCD122]
MPHSLVLNLLPQSPIPPQYLTGRHLHALFLTLVSSVDSTLGDRLHDSTADKAFTLSPLQINSPLLKAGKGGSKLQYSHQQPIPAGTPCWWRISLLDDTLFGKLTQLWLNLNPNRPWHLGPADLYITSIQGTPQSIQPWANATTYAQLYEEASDRNSSINLTFSTPTAFRQGQYDTTLPTRESVFNSLLSRWNKYSGIELSQIAIESIFPSFVNIHTEILADSRSKFIGVLGEVTYKILGAVEPIQIKQINALADFALYTGVGRKTTMGMGMTRRLQGTGNRG